jgi:hypothetical protein
MIGLLLGTLMQLIIKLLEEWAAWYDSDKQVRLRSNKRFKNLLLKGYSVTINIETGKIIKIEKKGLGNDRSRKE